MRRLNKINKANLRAVRHERVRARVQGTADRPRLSVKRGLKNVIAQLVNDEIGKTLCYASSQEIKGVKVEGKTAKVAKGYLVGKTLAEKAKALGIKQAVFDRGGYKYHGRIQAVAEGAREGGLEF